MLFRRKPTLEAARERVEALLERGKTADAETVMTQAVAEIEKKQGPQSADYFTGVEYLASCQALAVSADVAMARGEHARSQVAPGIFLQHGGDLAGAEPLLAEAIKTLPPDHPDSFPARNHLNAIRNNQTCGCGDGETAFLAGFQAYLDTQLPPEWRGKVHVSLTPGDGALGIQVDIPLHKGEPERLDHIVSHAWSTYLSRMQSHSFSE